MPPITCNAVSHTSKAARPQYSFATAESICTDSPLSIFQAVLYTQLRMFSIFRYMSVMCSWMSWFLPMGLPNWMRWVA